MSTETQNHQFEIACQQERDAAQYELDTLKALYDFEIRLAHHAGQVEEHGRQLDRLIADYDSKTSQGMASGTGRKVGS